MAKTLRVAYILGDFPSTSETFVLNQIAGAVEHGHQVDIHAWQGRGQLHHPLLDKYELLKHVLYRPSIPNLKGLHVAKACCLFIMLSLVDTRHTWRLFQMRSEMLLREWIELFFVAFSLRGGRSYDVIHAHFGPNGLMAVRLRQAGFLQGRVVTSFHGFDANVVPHALGKDYYHELFAQGDAFVVSSIFIQNKLLGLGCSKEKIMQIPVGIDVKAWAFQKRQGWQGKAPVLLSVGRLVEVKGFAYAIAAMVKVREVFADVQYHLVGDGELKSVLEVQVKALHLDDCVRFLGKKNQAELQQCYQQADVFVMPSVRASDGAEEGQGMVLFEAQAAGLPVIACDTGGIAESLPQGSKLVPEKDSDALAHAMIVQLESLRTQGYDGSAGRDFVQEQFDINQLNEQTLQLYERLA